MLCMMPRTARAAEFAYCSVASVGRNGSLKILAAGYLVSGFHHAEDDGY